MNAVDSSVVVAAFASWHEHHEAARRALDDGPRLVAHCAIESYSVLTRLPAPHRSPAHLVNEFLAARFPEPPLVLGADRYRTLLAAVAEHAIAGGAVYDALIAATATDAGATLLTIDRRGAQTYERIGAAVRFVV